MTAKTTEALSQVAYRTARVYDSGGNGIAAGWGNCAFHKLEKGDLFQILEPNGKSIDDGEVCVALTNPEPCEPKGNYTIQSMPVRGFDRHKINNPTG